jgi:hypothetical protein
VASRADVEIPKKPPRQFMLYPDLVRNRFAGNRIATRVSIGAACVVAACGAFTGTDVSSGDAGVDAGSSDGALTAEGAFTDGAFTDAPNAQVDGGGCTKFFSEAFASMPMGWMQTTSPGASVTIDPSPPGWTAPALHGKAVIDTVGEAAFLYFDVALPSTAKSVQATFSTYVNDAWGKAHVELGCAFEISDGTPPNTARFVNAVDGGSVFVSVAVPGTGMNATLYPAIPPAGWYDATMTLTGLDTHELVATTKLAPHGTNAFVSTSTSAQSIAFQQTTLRVSCGLMHSYSSASQMIDEWVANVVVEHCD